MFGDQVEMVDFSEPDARREEINAYIKNETTIKNFLSAGVVNENTNGVLINAAFFKAFWANAFDKYATEDKPFGNSGKTVSMMNVRGRFKHS